MGEALGCGGEASEGPRFFGWAIRENAWDSPEPLSLT